MIVFYTDLRIFRAARDEGVGGTKGMDALSGSRTVFGRLVASSVTWRLSVKRNI